MFASQQPTDPPSTSTNRPRKLNGIFKNRPAWANTEVNPLLSVTDEDPFSRSKDVYARLEEEKARSKEERKKEKPRAKMEGDGHRSAKRRRVSAEGSEAGESTDDYASATEEVPKQHNTIRRSTTPSKLANPTIKSEVKTMKPSPSKPIQKAPIVINVDSEDDSDDVAPIPPQPSYKPADHAATPELDQDDSDPEYAKLAAAARLRRKNARPSTPPLHTTTSLPTPPSNVPPPPDPIIKLFIHSTIPTTTPLIVQIRMTQRLKEVRAAWLGRQDLPQHTKDVIFLTWRRKRIFDFTTCKSLGVDVDEAGVVYIKGQTQAAGEGNTQLELQAMTAEMLEAERMPKESGADAGTAGVVDPKDVASIKLILKAKGFEDWRLVVKPSTKFAQIINVYCRKHDIAPDKHVSLVFDGDKLDEEDEVGDSEVGDMDFVEVHVR